MIFTFYPKGVCSRMIKIDINDDVIKSISFTGGCSGNTQGIARLTEGMKIDDAINKLSGIDCGGRGTSCPDQLSIALCEAKEKMK